MGFNGQDIQKKAMPFVNWIQKNIYLKAVMGGMMAAMPATIIGSLAALVKQIPIPAYQTFLTSHGIDAYLQVPINFTTNIIALIFVFCIAYSLADSFEVGGLAPGVVAMISFLFITPIQTTTDNWGQIKGLIPMDWLGSAGIFSAIIVALISARLFVFVVKKGWTIKMPDSVPPFIKNSFASLVPGIITSVFFVVVSAVFSQTSYGNMHAFIYGVVQRPVLHLGGSIWSMLLVAVLVQLFWFFGIHGMVVLTVMIPIWMTMDTAQLSAYSVGQELPNQIGLTFYLVYTVGGTALGLAILMLRAKSKRYWTLGKLAFIPAMFGITEPLIFGAPLVLNPLFAIPFIFGNVISVALAYLATIARIIPPMTGINAPTGTPVILQALIAGHWQNALFQLFLLALWVVMWYPFFRIADKRACEEEAGAA